MDHPPPATQFEDSDDFYDSEDSEDSGDTEASLSDNARRMTCEVARCKELNEVVKIDDLTTKHELVQKGDEYETHEVEATSRPRDASSSNLDICITRGEIETNNSTSVYDTLGM